MRLAWILAALDPWVSPSRQAARVGPGGPLTSNTRRLERAARDMRRRQPQTQKGKSRFCRGHGNATRGLRGLRSMDNMEKHRDSPSWQSKQ